MKRHKVFWCFMEKDDFDIMQDSLLTMEQICEKLSISRSTLDRWRGTSFGSRGKRLVINSREFTQTSDEPSIPFPKPILNIGRSPRWSANDINDWIRRLSNADYR